MLASLGRGLLHGDSETTGDKHLTIWKVKNIDFIALQGAYMKLYTDSFGAMYTKQLNKYIPQAFSPNFEVNAKQVYLIFMPIYISVFMIVSPMYMP
jgi:hypothetical protein